MDSQEYLNQISAQSTALKSGGSIKKQNTGLTGFLKSKYFLLGAIAVGAFVLLAIVGAILGSNKHDIKSDIERLKLHLDATSEVINEYQPNVKSSILRSHSASLNSVLANTSSQLNNYMVEKYQKKDSKPNKNLTEEAKTNQDALETELFEAKINGKLDRIYAHKMAYEIVLLNTEETNIYNSTKDKALQDILSESYDSLEKLYNDFNDFSETK